MLFLSSRPLHGFPSPGLKLHPSRTLHHGKLIFRLFRSGYKFQLHENINATWAIMSQTADYLLSIEGVK